MMSSFQAEKWPIFQEYHYRSWKKGLLYECSVQKVVNRRGWISTAFSKGRASWKKYYALCMVRSLQYLIWVNCSQTFTADLYYQKLEGVLEYLLRKWPALVNKRNILHENSRSQSARITLEKILDLGWSVIVTECFACHHAVLIGHDAYVVALLHILLCDNVRPKHYCILQLYTTVHTAQEMAISQGQRKKKRQHKVWRTSIETDL